MSRYKITLVGLYQYSDALFAQLTMPTFVVPAPDESPPIVYIPNKDTLISVILEKGGDFPVLYPDFDFMQFMTGVWSKNCAYMMQTLWDTMNKKYNMLDNYDRTSSISRSASSSGSGSATNSNTAFNSDSFKNTNKTESSDSSSGSETITENVHGNIGVTSSMQLLQQQRELALFKWYDVIADDYINKFCIQIY